MQHDFEHAQVYLRFASLGEFLDCGESPLKHHLGMSFTFSNHLKQAKGMQDF